MPAHWALYGEFKNPAYQNFLQDTSPAVAAIRMEMLRGKKAPAAMDYVLGDGAYAAFAKQAWEACREQPSVQS